MAGEGLRASTSWWVSERRTVHAVQSYSNSGHDELYGERAVITITINFSVIAITNLQDLRLQPPDEDAAPPKGERA